MDVDFDFDHFISGFRDARDESRLHELLAKLSSELGFAQFAMGHHVDLARPPGDAIRITNYDPDWIDQSVGLKYFVDDPIHVASTRTVSGFRWDEIESFIRLTDRQRLILERARTYGLAAGYTVPVHLPGEYGGTCSFGAPSFDDLERYALPLSGMGAVFAFESARRIMRSRDGRMASPVPTLTPRQRDSLILVGRGKGDAEIGAILGVSRSTAHEHVEASRRAYGNAQRPYMVARALFDGLISFADLFRR